MHCGTSVPLEQSGTRRRPPHRPRTDGHRSPERKHIERGEQNGDGVLRETRTSADRSERLPQPHRPRQICDRSADGVQNGCRLGAGVEDREVFPGHPERISVGILVNNEVLKNSTPTMKTWIAMPEP